MRLGSLLGKKVTGRQRLNFRRPPKIGKQTVKWRATVSPDCSAAPGTSFLLRIHLELLNFQIYPARVGRHQRQQAVADSEQDRCARQLGPPLPHAVHDHAGWGLHEKDAEAGNAGGKSDGIVMPATTSQEVVHKGKDDAGNFRQEEVRCVQANPASQRRRNCWSRSRWRFRKCN